MKSSETYGWVIVALLVAATIINFMDKAVMGLAGVAIMEEFQLSKEEFGRIGTAFYSLYALSGIACGFFLAPRISSKWLLVILVSVWSLAQLPIVFASTLGTIIVARTILGIGEGPGTPSLFHTAFEWFKPEKRNLPTAFIIQGGALGNIVAGPLLAWIIVEWGWRMAFVGCAAIGFLWLAAWLVLGKEGPYAAPRGTKMSHGEEAASAAQDAGPRITPLQFWTDPTMLAILAIGMSAYWVVGLVISWVAPFLQLELGFDTKTTGWVFSIVTGLQIPIHLTISWYTSRLLARGVRARLARGLANGICLIAGAIALFLSTQVEGMAAKLVLLALGINLPSVTFFLTPTVVGQIAPLWYRPTAVVVSQSAYTLGGLLAPWIAGHLIQTGGDDGFRHVFVVTSMIIGVAGIIAALFIRPEKTLARFERLGRRKG